VRVMNKAQRHRGTEDERQMLDARGSGSEKFKGQSVKPKRKT